MTTFAQQGPGTRYRVYMTPRVSQFGYGTEVEVTDHILSTGVKTIKRAIDSQDYEVGTYFYSDLELTGSNDNGYLNENDLRSIFPYFRDLTKVRVVFENPAGDTIVYYGLVNEQATRIDALQDTITFRVLSRDSVIGKTNVAGGVVTSGITAKQALYNILNTTAIQSVLGINLANINPSNNYTIDVGSAYDDQPAQDAINEILLFSNSIMKLDAAGNVYIQSRAATTTTPITTFYGPFDFKRRQNLITIQNYNTGLQRMFTSVLITDANSADHIKDDIAMSNTYGFNQKQISTSSINTAGTANAIAAALLAEFKVPKIELELEVPTKVANSLDLLDRVSIDWPLRYIPAPGQFMPVVGTTTIGNAQTPLPKKYGSLSIDPVVAFKVIEINQDPSTFTTRLKLRQLGTTLSDGFFSDPTSAIVSLAVIGLAKVGGTGSLAAGYNPSAVGAAQIAATKIA